MSFVDNIIAPQEFNDRVNMPEATRLDDDRFLVIFKSMQSGAVVGKVGTIDGNDVITWGTEYQVPTPAISTGLSTIALDGDRALVIGCNTSGQAVAYTATVAGDVVTYGTKFIWNGDTSYMCLAKLDATHFCINFVNNGGDRRGRHIVGTITGNNISFGTPTYWTTETSTNSPTCIGIDATHFCSLSCGAVTNIVQISIATVTNGNQISDGPVYDFNVGTRLTYSPDLLLLDPTHLAIFTQYGASTQILADIDGDSLVLGESEVLSSYSYGYIKSVIVDETKVLAFFQDDFTSKGAIRVGTYTDEIINWEDDIQLINDVNTLQPDLCVMNDYRVIGAHYNGNTLQDGMISIFNLNHPAIPMSLLFSQSSVKKNIRGKAKEGFIRPTIAEFFTSKNFYEVLSSRFMVATGGIVTTDGDYKIHKFLSSGTFEVTTLSDETTLEALVVAGGGSSGFGTAYTSSAGGGGGFLAVTDFTIALQQYAITVGEGGMQVAYGDASGINGGDSVFSTITAIGGGGGMQGMNGVGSAKSGGSGGGANSDGSVGSGVAGQGHSGGNSTRKDYGGGGGGAGSAGGTKDGGIGRQSSISGNDAWYAGGGAGWHGVEVLGGGGYYFKPAGTPNTGGGGAASNAGRYAGGSGIVIIRYKFQ